jgi:UDP-N-acetylmuramate--alanine ligase
LVVFSSAIPNDNIERTEAEKRGIQVVHRAELLSELMRFKQGITITGTHGKTTVTSMTAGILLYAGLDPTVVVGARVKSLGSNAHLGTGDYLVAEADESDRSLLKLCPIHTILTNIDDDHLDEYGSLENLEITLLGHLESIPDHGLIVACVDDSNTRQLLRKVHHPVVTYGLEFPAECSASQIQRSGLRVSYTLSFRSEELGEVGLKVPGRHNIQNSLGAAAMALSLGIPFESVCASLGSFAGVERRLEYKGEKEGIWVFDDYGHHPSEIEATLGACRDLGRKIVLIYQPHRYTRSARLASRLASCFQDAGDLYLTDIYAAGESPVDGIDSEYLAGQISRFRPVRYVPPSEDLVRLLKENVTSGDLLLTMGAGDIWKIGEAFLEESN